MSELMKDWNQFSVQFTSIILTTIVICTLSIIYNVKIRGHKEGQKMSGFLVLVEMLITWVENMVVSIMGTRHRKLTPYILYLILYIVTACLISLIGIEAAMSSYTVAFSMGFVTFIGIYYFGFKYQKWAYFKVYYDPVKLITQFTPLISISFRLFGNLLGGSIIMGLLYALSIGIQAGWSGDVSIAEGHKWLNWDIFNATDDWDLLWKQQYVYFWSGFNVITTFIAPFLHMFFDLFAGAVQSVVFSMLTLSYWSEAIGEKDEPALTEHIITSQTDNELKIETKKLDKKQKEKYNYL